MTNPTAPFEKLADKPKELEASKKEIAGWYLYDWANGAFFYVAMNFFPLMITAQAREAAMERYCGECLNNEWAKDYNVEGSCSLPTYETNSTCVDGGGTWHADLKDDAKNVNFLGMNLGYASFSLFCIVLAVFIQLILFISMGSFADFGSNRKLMFIIVNSIGLVPFFLVYFFGDFSYYWANGILFIITNVAFTLCLIFYNAYLPLLASARPEVLEAKKNGATSEEILALETKNMDQMSSRGLAIGYIGQLLILVCVALISKFVTSTDWLNSRLALMIGGFWMLVFTTMTFMFLKTRPGPQLPAGESYCTHSIRQTYRTFKSFKELRELGKYLIAFFIFSDGSTTLAQAAVVFAQEELKMGIDEILYALLGISIVAVLGCAFFLWLHEKKGISAKHILAINLSLMALIPIHAFFLKTKWEFYLGIAVFGINTGSQQAFMRSIFAQNLPNGREAEYFSFYAISDKGTAWLGPLLVGVVNHLTGEYRYATASIILFFVVGIALLLFNFDAEKAKEQKVQFDQKYAALDQQQEHL